MRQRDRQTWCSSFTVVRWQCQCRCRHRPLLDWHHRPCTNFTSHTDTHGDIQSLRSVCQLIR